MRLPRRYVPCNDSPKSSIPDTISPLTRCHFCAKLSAHSDFSENMEDADEENGEQKPVL
jgi:hypothetical protein